MRTLFSTEINGIEMGAHSLDDSTRRQGNSGITNVLQQFRRATFARVVSTQIGKQPIASYSVDGQPLDNTITIC
jgi:hypothetical protein